MVETSADVEKAYVQVRWGEFLDGHPKGTVEYQIGITATPDPARPLSDTLDDLRGRAEDRVQAWLKERRR